MTELVDFKELVIRCLRACEASAASHRLVIALAGAPGSGKSTLAARLVQSLNAESSDGEPAIVVPMDGFHLDNAILTARNQLPVKGSPGTFDVAGFYSLLQRLRAPLTEDETQDGCAEVIYIPLFDRASDLARVAADEVTSSHKIIVVEGNYLLLGHPPWTALRKLFDLTVMLQVPLEVIEERLVQRWLDHGLSRAQARERALTNDIPNAHCVLEESQQADLYFESVRQ
jgi:pantothenate kinase